MNSRTAPLDTAAQIATQALAERGIPSYTDDDAGNSWLVVGLPQSADTFPSKCVRHVVLYVVDPFGDQDEVMVDRAPTGPSDHWCAVSVDSKGVQRPLIARPIPQLAACIEAIANWLTPPPV
ncbi:hypothetical protein [Streptomyces capitiformicae]|uniref:Uncharacterized protein n=1 Tax=Streptomyces capitiformicae TaxID=2014920 RepID=A0A919DDB6_9ACTN|nr:hypothetical protein [Streptomyces capitiformicae]GHE34810.1 hypothetical protein GCM10017771_52610 [Streptomyces capitiformicae]